MGLLLTTVEGLEEVALAEAERRGLKPGGVIRPSLLLVEGAAEEALKLKTVDSVSELLCSFESGDLGLRALRHALRECFRGISREGCSGRVRVRAWARIPGVSRRALELVAARELSRVLRVGTSPEAGPTVRIYLCSGGRILVAKQLNDEPLHLRQYYVFKHPHTLNPLIAAALPLLAPAGSLHDPCCGSGTIPIEYLLARPETLAVCSDVNSEYARRALENSRRAGTDVEVLVADLFHSPLAREVELVAANPPRRQRCSYVH